MDKPRSLSVKDFLIRKMSVKLNKQEDVIDAIVSHQFKSANEALKLHNTVELSGFCKFIFNEKKAYKRMEKALSQREFFKKTIEDESSSNTKRNSANIKLKNIEEFITSLNQKLNGTKGDN